MDIDEKVSVELDVALVREAEALGVDVEACLTAALAHAVERHRLKPALEGCASEYDAHIDKHGLWYRDYVGE